MQQNIKNLYNYLDIKLKNPILKLKYHKNNIKCAIVLDDGRFATCSSDKSIIIYNKITFKPDLIIKEHCGSVNCILQLSSDMLASCSQDIQDSAIKIFKIYDNNYEVFQTLNYHEFFVYKIIELRNKKLVSCSDSSSIIIYSKDNHNKYIRDYAVKTRGICFCLIQTKENEICYYDDNNGNDSICFYDLLEKKFKSEINNISVSGYSSFNMVTKDLLLITGYKTLSIINVNQRKLVRILNAPDSSYIYASCLLNKNILLTGDYNKKIKEWKIEGDNLELISTKENAHNNSISTIIKIGDRHILSGSFDDGIIKIWHFV